MITQSDLLQCLKRADEAWRYANYEHHMHEASGREVSLRASREWREEAEQWVAIYDSLSNDNLPADVPQEELCE